MYARVLKDFVIGRSYGVYSALERPWLLVKNLDAYVENTYQYVGISTIFFFDAKNCVHEREMNIITSYLHIMSYIILIWSQVFVYTLNGLCGLLWFACLTSIIQHIYPNR